MESSSSDLQLTSDADPAPHADPASTPAPGPTRWRDGVARVFGVRLSPSGGRCPCGCYVQHHLRFAWWALVLVFFAIVLALAIAKLARGDVTVEGVRQHRHWVAVVVGGAFSLCASVITALQIHGHAAHYAVPEVQGKIVRIALIVPVFAWSAWLSLLFMELAPYFDFIHECYEAYTIYNFVLLLLRYMGGPEGAERLMARKSPPSAPWPACCGLCCSARFSLGLLDRLRKATLQFVFVAPAVALVAAIGGLNGRYQEGEASVGNLYPWCTLVLGCSKVVALYALIWFYKATKAELAPFKPLTKFLVVKSVVFLTFFQGVLISILGSRGALRASEEFTTEELEATLQNFIICVEMFFAAAAHRIYFGHEPFVDGSFDRQLHEMAELNKPAAGTAAAREEEEAVDRERQVIAKLSSADPDTLA